MSNSIRTRWAVRLAQVLVLALGQLSSVLAAYANLVYEPTAAAKEEARARHKSQKRLARTRDNSAAKYFRLRPLARDDKRIGFTPKRPALGTVTNIRDVTRELLDFGPRRTRLWSELFGEKIPRWAGPAEYPAAQLGFEEHAYTTRLDKAMLEKMLSGIVLVMRHPRTGQVDYVARDHHMLDIVLYHYWTTGELPSSLVHWDRHSDWGPNAVFEKTNVIKDNQAATWVKGLTHLVRPDRKAVVSTKNVFYGTEHAAFDATMSGRPTGSGMRWPSVLKWRTQRSTDRIEREQAKLTLASSFTALEEREAKTGKLPEWLSLDLDLFFPRQQARVALPPFMKQTREGGIVRRLMQSESKVRVFSLSPTFLNGGDNLQGAWKINGNLHGAVSVLNTLRTRLTAPLE